MPTRQRLHHAVALALGAAVTDIAVVEAFASRQTGFDDALRSGLARLCGPPDEVEAAQVWLVSATRV